MHGIIAFALWQGGNPANNITAGLRAAGSARLAVASALGRYVGRWSGNVAAEQIDSLVQWAAVEALNSGSLQRSHCPLAPREGGHDYKYAEHLRGSGRWFANDEGGHWRLLRDTALAWARTSDETQSLWHLVAKGLSTDEIDALAAESARIISEFRYYINKSIENGSWTNAAPSTAHGDEIAFEDAHRLCLCWGVVSNWSDVDAPWVVYVRE